MKKNSFHRQNSAFRFRGLVAIIVGFFASQSMTETACAQGRLILSDGISLNLSNGTSSSPLYVVVDNNQSNAISSITGGHIKSEGQFNVLRWNISDATGVYVVPFVGNNAQFIPVTLEINTSGSIGGSVDFSTYGTGTDNLPLPAGVSSIAHADTTILANGAKLADRYWFMDASTYTTKPGGFVSLTYDPSSQTGDLIPGVTAMSAQFYDGTQWVIDQFGIDDLNGMISGIPVSDAFFFNTLTLVQNGAPLPITLLNFNALWANSEKSRANIFWTTASEFNNDFFEVLRSRDGTNWHTLDVVQGAGTSINNLNYNIVDENPLSGVSYYRLKQVDYDGTLSFSHIVPLNKDHEEENIIVFPNPAHSNFVINFRDYENTLLSIVMIDNTGREVYREIYNTENNQLKTIDVSDFHSGIYNLLVTSENGVFAKKVAVTH